MMTVQPLKNEQAVVPMVGNQKNSSAVAQSAGQFQWIKQPQQSADKKLGTAGARDVLSGATIAPASKTTGRLAAVQTDSAARAEKAQAVRVSKAVEEQMESMQEKMDEIVNSYPPFLRGSEKRQKYLMSISSIRKQIEAMIVPPVRDNTAADAASINGAKKVWKNLFENIGMPELEPSGPNEASDAQIQAASSAVGAMKADLARRRAALEQQAISPTPISANAAQYISRAIGQGLTNSDLSLTANLTGALKGL